MMQLWHFILIGMVLIIGGIIMLRRNAGLSVVPRMGDYGGSQKKAQNIRRKGKRKK